MSLLVQTLDYANMVVGSGAAPAPELKSSSDIQNSLTSFLLPIVFIAIGAIAIKFLVQKQMTQFFQFAAIAMLVLLLLVKPDILQSIAQWFAGILQ